MRDRGESNAYLVALADGRFAVTGAGLIAIGGRRALAGWCEGRADRDIEAAERAWWQEVTGALIARGRSAGPGGPGDLGIGGRGVGGAEDG
jgi:hypothetical protein